jgi:hypothetical protein
VTEYAEDFEDEYEDESIYDEIDELRDQLEDQEEVAEVNAQIAALERAHGSPFSQDEIQQIGELIDEGYTPESVYEAVAPTHPGEEAFDHHFSETLEHVQEQQGRQLSQSEVDNLYDKAVYEGDPRHVEDGAIRDMGNKRDRISLINERIAEKDPGELTDVVVEPLGEDATGKDRAAFIDARLAGAEVADTYEGDE